MFRSKQGLPGSYSGWSPQAKENLNRKKNIAIFR